MSVTPRSATPPSFEARWRDALLDGMIPSPGGGLPALAEIDRAAFWPRFHRSAPLMLRFGWRMSIWCLGGALPLVLGYGVTVERLDPRRRDALLARASRMPLVRELVEVVKIVACFAYFDDDDVQARVRSGDDT